MSIADQEQVPPLVDFVKQDCAKRGRGSKKLWANKLGVSQMTLSHWLTGRREPNAHHLHVFYIAYQEALATKEKSIWANWLWQNYYENREVDAALLKVVALRLVKADGLLSRTWALLSWFFSECQVPPFQHTELLVQTHLNNKLGWLYESAGLESLLQPIPSKQHGTLFENAGVDLRNSDRLRSYLARQQTDLGKKWSLYDCPLEELKEQLSWRQ